MRRTVITATNIEYAPLLIEREELTEDGWQRRSLAIAEGVMPMRCEPAPYDGVVLLRFLNHRFLIEEPKDAEG